MDEAVPEQSPLEAYLNDDTSLNNDDNDMHSSSPRLSTGSSPASQRSSSSPLSSFAPRGRPTVASRFRHRLTSGPGVSVPQTSAAAVLYKTYSEAITSRIGRAENTKFLEQYRYIIVTSQLLSNHQYHGQSGSWSALAQMPDGRAPEQVNLVNPYGAAATASFALGITYMIRWSTHAASFKALLFRITMVSGVLVVIAILGQAFLRRRMLQYLRQQNILETTKFVELSQNLDAAMRAALSLIQEVELVSRGYRISLPLPPVTRLDTRSQTRRCLQIRRALLRTVKNILPRTQEAYRALQPLAETLNLEKYYDVYDISDADMQEALLGYSESEFEDLESLRVLKILASRSVTLRKMFLCCLLALPADGTKDDYTRWRTAMDEIKDLCALTANGENQLRSVLEQEEFFPIPATPKVPLTPGRERWRGQVRKFATLSTGIRSLQAKMHVLREESDKALDESEDISDLSPHLMVQYDSIGMDLQVLIKEWEAGKAALANTIDRNEKRISSMSGMMSPTTSLGGLTSVEEGGPAEALRALNGENSRSSPEPDLSEDEKVYEAISMPKRRERSTFTREERIAKMKEDRVKRESARERTDASTSMLRELESVINLRPRGKTNGKGTPGHERVTSI